MLVAALMLIPGLISLLPSSWQDDISPYLPSNAGESMFALTHDATSLSPARRAAGLPRLDGRCALAGAAYRLVRTRRLTRCRTGGPPRWTGDHMRGDDEAGPSDFTGRRRGRCLSRTRWSPG